MRDFINESRDLDTHKYAYDFDHVLRQYMMRAFDPLLPKGKALELGCYKGAFTKILAAQYPDLTVVEAAENLIAQARQQVDPKVAFIHGRFEDVDLQPEYDAIFFVHTLEHLDDPVAVLQKVRRWLSPKGRLFLVVPNANAPSRQIAVKMGLISHNAAVTADEFEHGHRITYTLDTLERDALGGGLNIIQRGGVFFKPFANFQFDRLLKTDIIDQAYMDGCYALGMQYPDLCASIFVVCTRGD